MSDVRLQSGLYPSGEDIPLISIGILAYKPYKPKRVCKVIENVGYAKYPNPEYHGRLVRVKWNDGKEEVLMASSLNKFDSLIESHQRKLDSHLKMKAIMEQL
jgi:hypothetical protein